MAGALVALGALAPAAEASLVSQGAFRVGADALWSQALTGSGQTIAILDLGFANLGRSIAAGELPPRERMVTMSFDAARGLDGLSAVGAETEHGVRMAEIAWDMAPDAQLVLVNYHTLSEFERAVDWLIAQGIPIVSHSNSFLSPPHDGTGRAARAVDRAAAAGILWVNSAGNYAERHWEGTVDAAGVVLPIAPAAGDPLAMALGWRGGPPGTVVSLALERQGADGGWREVARSGPDPDLQDLTAPAGVTPVVRADGSPHRVVLRALAGGPALVEVFSRSAGFGAMAAPAGSVPTPGDAAGSLTVAAVPWTGTELAPYSSRGPTDDGRAKPDIAGPTYITSNVAWPGTAGTSAATPHLAAGAALLRQRRQAAGLPADLATLRAELLGTAVDLGDPGPDLGMGAGLLRLDTQAPRVRLRVGPGRRPIVRVRVGDDGTVGTVRFTLDGQELALRRSPRAQVRLPELAPGRHTLTVTAGDLAGNAASATVRIRRPG